MEKVLIVYYSFEGFTKEVVETLNEHLHADVLALKPKSEIKQKGFMKYVWGGRQSVMKKNPELEDYQCEVDDYDLIIIATPVWAFTFSPPIRSFVERQSFANTKLALVYTHEGGPGKTVEKFKDFVSPNEVIGSIGIVNPIKDKAAIRNQFVKWLGSLGIEENRNHR